MAKSTTVLELVLIYHNSKDIITELRMCSIYVYVKTNIFIGSILNIC